MIPLRDSIPRVYTPVASWCIIGLNVLVFLYLQGLSDYDLYQFYHIHGLVPARLVHPNWAAWRGYPSGYDAVVSYMFLHGGWMHLLANMWTMWIFADNIEDVMGPVRFAFFYLFCGLAALALHLAFNADSVAPVLGASGAIAGVMGAYFRLYPRAKVLTLIPIFIFPYFVNLPAVLYLGIWFLIQVFSGLSSIGIEAEGGGIAWWAHAGGFLAGILLLPLFRVPSRCHYCYRNSGPDSFFSS